jgi:hypothetical protein
VTVGIVDSLRVLDGDGARVTSKRPRAEQMIVDLPVFVVDTEILWP